MAVSETPDSAAEVFWRAYMLTGQAPKIFGAPWYVSRPLRPFVRHLPAEPRCRLCEFPFQGVGGLLAARLFGVKPSKLNPRLCNLCERAASELRGGAEIEMSLVFADVRGSTTIAERLPAAEFSRLIDRFYQAATRALYRKYGLLEKLIGDEVAGFFVPGIAGPDHARAAVEAAEDVLRATGHGSPGGPWVPVGVGVHTGVAFVGTVSPEGGVPDITVLGDTVNIAARLASQARAGELLVSEATRAEAGLAEAGLEHRHLALKGRAQPIQVWVKQVAAG